MTTEERLAVVETKIETMQHQIESNSGKLDKLILELTSKKGLATGIVISATTLASIITFLLTYFKGIVFGNG